MISRGLSWYVIASVIGVAVFGFGAMATDSDNSHGHGSCIAIAVLGNICPETSPLGFLDFHVQAFSAFGLAILQLPALAFLTFTFLLSLLLIQILNPPSLYTPKSVRFNYALDIRSSDLPSSQNILRWFSLHENSPQFSLALR